MLLHWIVTIFHKIFGKMCKNAPNKPKLRHYNISNTISHNKWNREHPDLARKSKERSMELNPDYGKKYRESCKEQIKEYNSKYYVNHKDYFAKYQIEWRKNNPDKYALQLKKQREWKRTVWKKNKTEEKANE